MASSDKALREADTIGEFKDALRKVLTKYRPPIMSEADYTIPQPELLKAFRDGQWYVADMLTRVMDKKETNGPVVREKRK